MFCETILWDFHKKKQKNDNRKYKLVLLVQKMHNI